MEAQGWWALHWGLLKQTAIRPTHRRSIPSVSLIMLFPWEGKSEFPDAVCYITGILEQQWTRSNVHAYLNLSAAGATIDSGCFWHVCSCLCESPELHDWLVFFVPSGRTQMAVLGDCSHALRGISSCVAPNSSILSPFLFSHRSQLQGLQNPHYK